MSVADIDDTTCSLRQFDEVHCGAPDGNCPKTTTSDHGQYSTQYTPSPLGTCSNPDAVGCRFQCVAAPTPHSGNALKFTAHANGASQGDWDSGFHGPRNEVVSVFENDMSGTKVAKRYVQNDNRYYSWHVFIPSDFPDPPCSTDCSRTCSTTGPITPSNANAFQIMLQFHDDGNCKSGTTQLHSSHVPLTLGVNRTYDCGTNTGLQYRFTLNVDSDYGPSDMSDSEAENLVWAAPTALTKNHWYDVVLHVKWSTVAATASSSWGNPDGGVVELWIDGDHKVSSKRATLSVWPGSAACSDDNTQYPGNANQPMTTYLKTGLYLDENMLNYTSSITVDNLLVGTSCASVWPGGCPR